MSENKRQGSKQTCQTCSACQSSFLFENYKKIPAGTRSPAFMITKIQRQKTK